jgi:large subunit ribosomal protein L10
MKTKSQKQEELDKGRELLEKSQAVLLIDFGKVKTADLRNLRRELKKSGNPLFVIKKRLLGLIFKEKNLELPVGGVKAPMGAVFASNLEEAAGSVYRFFKGLEKDKKVEAAGAKMVGGYDLMKKEFIPAEQAVFIGQLPPREALLAQLLGMLAAPIRSFLYVLSEKSKQVT